MTTLIDIVLQRATTEPDTIAYRFLQGAEFTCDSLSYGQLAQQARALAAQFQQSQAPQARLLLACKSQKNFALAFFGCMLAGMIAVPTALPRRRHFAERLRLLADDAQVSAVVFDCDDINADELAADGLRIDAFDLRACLAHPQQQQLAQDWLRPAIDGAAIAFLQYTSGSTGAPKGVVVSHANLMHNSAVIQQAMQISAASSVFTALPMFHDMGLVGGLLQPMYSGCPGHWISPSEFVQYPERWLQIMSRFKITISGGPNFMYELAAREIRPEQIEGIDLSAWKIAFCGAEPVRASTMALFAQRFKADGFDGAALYPCYGMAESTLFISGKQAGAQAAVCSELGSPVVSCGVAWQDTTVHIVDPVAGQTLPERGVGEIWVGGRSVAEGYWRRAELSEQVFRATLAAHPGQAFLRTGDLGYLKDGELYVTGRLKDLIIMYGKKYAPQDLEDEAEASHDGVRGGGGAAFAVSGEGAEAVVLVLELRREWMRRHDELASVKAAIRQAIQRGYGLALDDIALIRPGSLPRTSSGKVMRSQCRDEYLRGALALVPELA